MCETRAVYTVFALGAVLERRARLSFCSDYTAQMLGMIARALYPGADMPSYMEMVSPQATDRRTGDEVVAGMIEKFRERRES